MTIDWYDLERRIKMQNKIKEKEKNDTYKYMMHTNCGYMLL